MPFKPDLRKRLQDLKVELESGILPQSLYEEMCREAIADYGVEPFEGASGPTKNYGETMTAVLTPSQSAILAALGDMDINMLLPFIRRQRKRMLRSASDMTKHRVACPECDKEFLNTQGLSTHLLAKHRHALDDYYIDTNSRKLVLKPEGWVPTPSQADGKLSGLDMGRGSLLESGDAMANLVSAAVERSNGGDGLWLVQQVRESTSDGDGDVDGDVDEDDDDDDDDDEGDNEMEEESKSPTVEQNSTATNDSSSSSSNRNNNPSSANQTPDGGGTDARPNGITAITKSKSAGRKDQQLQSLQNPSSDDAREGAQSKSRNVGSVKSKTADNAADNSSDASSHAGDTDKMDRRKFNRGVKQRKSYSKDVKLSVIGMRDQGKCTDEISIMMSIPKSNVEKWCSAKGRDKILRDIYRDVVSQRPRSYTAPPNVALHLQQQQQAVGVGGANAAAAAAAAAAAMSQNKAGYSFSSLYGSSDGFMPNAASGLTPYSLSVDSRLFTASANSSYGSLSSMNPYPSMSMPPNGLAYKMSSGPYALSANAGAYSTWPYSPPSGMGPVADSLPKSLTNNGGGHQSSAAKASVMSVTMIDMGNNGISSGGNNNGNGSSSTSSESSEPAEKRMRALPTSTSVASNLSASAPAASSVFQSQALSAASAVAGASSSLPIPLQAPSASAAIVGQDRRPAAAAASRVPIAPKVVKPKATPAPKKKATSTATAAAAVAQSISFNNDGFSDSDDDHEVMGLLGEQLPIVALQRLTQMRP